ncbi:ead/Ea22-like family protein [Salmonella enterica subsp. enterica]
MTIDKQALREAAEKADSGEWSYEEFNRMDLPGGAHININGRDAIYCLKKPVGGVEQSRAVTAFIAAFNPKVALALLDENLQLQREKDATEAVALALRDDMRQAREQLAAAERRKADSAEPAGYHVIKECGKVGCSVATLEEAEKTRDFWNKRWAIRPYFYTPPARDNKQTDELVMWVKRLAHSLRNARPNSKLHDAAMDYLSRKGLISVEDVLR